MAGKWVKRFLVVDGPEEDRGFNHDDFVHKYCYVLEIEMSKEAPDDTYWYEIGDKACERVVMGLQLLAFVIFQIVC